jgi:type I restriction-modification system DNA methylase subunit
LWQAADALRSNMDAAEYKHVVLGLIFLKYISDAFEEYHGRLEAQRAQGADPEDPDEYRAVNIFWVPKEARWSQLLANAKQPTIGKVVDDAMLAIERDNPAPTGLAGFVLANGSMSSNQSGEGEIRKNIIEADLVDCMVALPGQLFYSTQIPVCLWFIARDKRNSRFRDRRGETLFLDARQLGSMIDRVHRELTDEDIGKVADTYHAWRGDKECEAKYEDVPGFCKAATLDDIRQHSHILTPGRYVGAAEVEDDGEPFEERMERLTTELEEQFAESARLEAAIRQNLELLWGSAGD